MHVPRWGSFNLCGDGLCVGRDSSDAVSADYPTPSEFRGGTIKQVEISVGDDRYVDLEREAFAALARESASPGSRPRGWPARE